MHLKNILPGTILCLTTALSLNGQDNSKPIPKVNQFLDLTATVGNSQGSVAASYVYNWRLGKSRKFEVGFGGRLTSYFGTKKDFITAGPAELTRTFTTPFLIVFAGQNEENFDTLTVQRPLVNSVNASINLGYHFSKRFYGGFNIDLIGFSFGPGTSAVFQSNGETMTEPKVKPSPFNILLTGDHDHGTLNSEFFLKYHFGKRWAIKGVYQFLFVEYTTETVKQIAPDGTVIDRFRNKANNFGIGVSYNIPARN